MNIQPITRVMTTHPTSAVPSIQIEQLTHRYGRPRSEIRTALSSFSISIPSASIFVFLGPNGSGKSTLFRVLSTLIPPQSGKVHILGFDLVRERSRIRERLGVVFQSPSLDKKLTAWENLAYHAALFGIPSREFRLRAESLLQQLKLEDRARERTEHLSGGLRRRVELAKAMLHQPQLLLMDEPSTGLDPGARSDLWRYLQYLRDETGVSIVLTSHLLEEADRADQIAILNQGQLVAEGTPADLCAALGGETLTLETTSPQELATSIQERFHYQVQLVGDQVRLEHPDGHRLIPSLLDAFSNRITAIRLGKPTLEDVFIAKTGHQFWSSSPKVSQ